MILRSLSLKVSGVRSVTRHILPLTTQYDKTAKLLREQKARAKAERKLEKLEERQGGEAENVPAELIPRPDGTLGKDWHLREAMGLADNKPMYNRILVS